MLSYLNNYVVQLTGRQLLFILTWIVCSFIYWLTSSAAIPLSHDWEYSYKLTEQSAWRFIIEHYTQINGRVLVHVLIGFFAECYPLWLVINALFICALPLLLIKTVYKSSAVLPLSYSLLLLAWLAIMLGFPNDSYYRIGFFWLTGSLNYVWPTLMALFVFHNLWGVEQKHQQWSQSKFVSVLTIAFLTAGTHEQISMLVLGFSFTRLGWDYWKNKILSYRLAIIALATVIGASLLFLAPGNFVRLADVSSTSIFESVTLYSGYLANQYFTNSRLNLLPTAFIFTQGLLFWCQFSKADSRSLRIWLLSIASLLLAGSLAVELVNTLSIQIAWLVGFLIAQLCISVALVRHGKISYVVLLLAMLCSQLLLLAIPDALGPRMYIPTLLLMSTLVLWALALWLKQFTSEGGPNHIYKYAGLFMVLTVAVIQVFPQAAATHKYYAENRSVQLLNKAKIQVWKESSDTSKPISLVRLPNLPWEMPYSNVYFTEYFYYHHALPPEAVVIWTGVKTDTHQRSAIVELHLLRDNVAKSEVLLTTGPGDTFCKIHRLEQFIIFSHNSWSCGKIIFNSTIFSKEGNSLGRYRDSLYGTQYIPAIHNLTGNYSSHFVYTLPLLGDGYATIEWLGAKVTVN
jgi:hypothetical protein